MKNVNMIINYLSGCQDKTLEQLDVTWGELLIVLSGKEEFLRKGELTLDEYQAASDKARKADKDGRAWIPCSARDAAAGRSQSNMDRAYLLVLDIDTGMLLDDVKSRIAGLEAAIHSSYSHTPEKPKWRVVLPLAEPIPAAQIGKVFDHFQVRFDGLLDASCGHDPARLYYLPACPKDAEPLFVYEHLEGELLDGAGLVKKVAVAPTKTPSHQKIAAGNRNNYLTKIAGRLRHAGNPTTEIEDTLKRINAERCDPPLDESEMSTIAASVGKYASSDGVAVGIATTDTGNAQRLVAKHGQDVKFVPEQGKWIVWKDGHWEVDAAGKLMQCAKATAKSIFDDVAEVDSDSGRMALAKHASQSLNSGRLRSMIALASSEPDVVVHIGELDRDDFLLGVGNGVVDLRDGNFRSAQRSDFLTLRCGTEFQPAATCPKFERFIERVTGGDIELQGYLQRLVGYTLTGSTREHCFAFLYGHGANGKSTFLDTLMRLLGDYATQTQPETLMARRGGGANNDLARLVSKRLVVSNEVREGAHLEENLVKQLVGGDVVTARFLYREHFEFRPRFKLLIAGNHQPVIKGDDDGIWRRVHLVPFVHTIPESERDKDLGAKLANELPGILNWAIAGCLAWQKRGLDAPTIIREATARYREEMDLLGAWIVQRCDVGTGLRYSSRRLYEDYRKWCEEAGIKPVSAMVFVRKLETRKFHREHTRHGNFLLGIQLKPIGGVKLSLAA